MNQSCRSSRSRVLSLQSVMCISKRAEHPACFAQTLIMLASRIRIRNNPGAYLPVHGVLSHHGHANRNGDIKMPVGIYSTDNTTIRTATRYLQFINDLHSAHFRSSRERAYGECGTKCVKLRTR